MKKKKKVVKRNDLKLRRQYEAGELSAEEFLDKLFNSNDADRKRKRIEEKNSKTTKSLQKA
ncbi:hypothetical protein SAMN05192534_12460 [Alteribacillus persepolensis]|uniref:Uncharacterized protein n=1 Tax=Alteribacillus persepolensis TaxID=568899 RepID=A0A1G8IKH0_9BACI|nr:hypothetical protein SAMN05192534_12460 [Alteribacillus persepolensis]